jgi:DUF4097 and DUF4098 domain-containing protein YvlB
MEERKMILNMLNEGKITADEATRLLEALGVPKTEHKTETPEQEEAVESYIVKVEDAKQHGQSKTKSKEFNKEQSISSKISELLDRVVKKVKDVDIDFNFGSSVEVQHIFQDQDLDFKNIKVEVPNGKVSLKQWDENGVRAECQANVYKVETIEDARSKFIEAVKLESNQGQLLFKVIDKHVKVNVVLHVPKKQYEEAILSLGNGGLDIEDLNFHELKGATSNGTINLTNASGKILAMETKNGAIDVVNSHWDKGEFETWNGSIRVDGSFVDLEAETLNGSITSRMPKAVNGKAEFKTLTGKINIFVPSELEVKGELKTFAGGLNCLLDELEIIENKKDYAQKSLKFKANNGAVFTYNIEAETKTGSITIDKI